MKIPPDGNNITVFPHWCLPCLTMIKCRSDLESHLQTHKHRTKAREMRGLETWKKCAKENIVKDLKCLSCDIEFISLPILLQHLETPSHRGMAAVFKSPQVVENDSEEFSDSTQEEDETAEAFETMDTSDSSMVVQVDSLMLVSEEAPALEEITHLNNIALEDIMIQDDD